MSETDQVAPEFVEEIPRELAQGRLYVSITYATAVHLCCCGCGHEVVTPLHPTRWALTWDGQTASLHPSVGSHGLPCRSHYVIERNRVHWAARWSKAQIEACRAREKLDAAAHFSRDQKERTDQLGDDSGRAASGILRSLSRMLRSR